MSKGIKDKCPKWADDMLKSLFEMEQFLGNIPANEDWKSNFVDEVHRNSSGERSTAFKESDAEVVFSRVVKGLVAENFSTEDIMAIINLRVSFKDGLKYCSHDEVVEVLK